MGVGNRAVVAALRQLEERLNKEIARCTRPGAQDYQSARFPGLHHALSIVKNLLGDYDHKEKA